MKTRRSSRLAKTVKAAALVGAPLLLAENELHAAIIYVNTPQTFAPDQHWIFNSGGLNFDERFRQFGSGPRMFGSGDFFAFARSSANALPLSPGTPVVSSLAFGDGGRFPATSSTNYYGFRFSSSGTHYGWAQISNNSTGPSLTVLQFAVQTTADTPIIVGVPEPADFAAGLGALAIGAAAVLRRRQKEKAAQAA